MRPEASQGASATHPLLLLAFSYSSIVPYLSALTSSNYRVVRSLVPGNEKTIAKQSAMPILNMSC
ncbi:hypothetical protein LZ31DRAFT_549026 [Colletotrichum somersetense]|nr:hypothetical protein LZ31DRAFT_549026 [Colletotrichum somersetense]